MKAFLLALLMAAAAVAQTPSPAPSATPPADEKTLDPVLAAPDLWETSAASWVEANKALGFHWLSDARDAAQSTRKGAKFLGEPVCQTVARCADGKIAELNVLFYNRGDMGELGKAEYEGLIKRAVTAISAAAKVNFVPKGRDASNAVKVDGVVWTTPVSTYTLEYSCTRTPAIAFRSEFVRLRIVPTPKPKNLIQEALEASKRPGPFRGEDHVTRDTASGDVVIKDVPMVDQGQKGYCVVSTAERLMRYYGIKADEHELAQLADSDAEKGTSYRLMAESLKKLTARLKIRVRTLLDVDLESVVDAYNEAAQKARVNPVRMSVDEAGEIFAQMNADVFRASRLKNRAAFGSFNRQIKMRIDQGVPLLWSVVVGVLDTDGSKARRPGGHMRLVIGYNEKTHEILFSDSWGPGHELKRMPAADAWTITHGLVLVEPL